MPLNHHTASWLHRILKINQKWIFHESEKHICMIEYVMKHLCCSICPPSGSLSAAGHAGQPDWISSRNSLGVEPILPL
jgi:hypothetical protein